MEWDWRGGRRKQKTLFKSYYCAGCKQRKVCGLLTGWDSEWKNYCCQCYYKNQQEQAGPCSSYEKVFADKQRERKAGIRQLQLLKDYSRCPHCGSKEVDAYSLYEDSQLICRPCLIKREGRSSGPISFLEQEKWHKKFWKISISEWLENFSCLPVNKECADKWLKDWKHLDKCNCLESEAKELHLLFANSLKKCQEQLKDCKCETNSKIRVDSNYYAWCETCGESISVASKKRVIKNRNDPRFWGLNIKKKVLCGNCLEKRKEKMTPLRRAKFNEYRKLGRL